MRNLNYILCTISEKIPEDNHQCLVKRYNKKIVEVLVYNSYYNCWDTSDGDDFESSVNDKDLWTPLPSLK